MSSSFFALLDDVIAITKIAAAKTAGAVGDDIAVSAERVNGIRSDRETPVVLAIAKGSLINKVWITAGAIALSIWASWAIIPLLIAGGIYLAMEGVEKVLGMIRGETHEYDPGNEAQTIKSAIAADAILSLEILVLALSVVSDKSIATQVGVLAATSIVMTVGVYGTVWALIRMDDLGLMWVTESKTTLQASAGRALLKAAPVILEWLTVIGATAMMMVGGSILLHNVPTIHHTIQPAIDAIGGGFLASTLAEILVGANVGLIALTALTLGGLLGQRVKYISLKSQVKIAEAGRVAAIEDICVYQGYFSFKGTRIDVIFDAPIHASEAEKDQALMNAVMAEGEFNYLLVGQMSEGPVRP